MIIAVIDANFAVRLIPLWSSTGDEDSLYNEIAPSLSDNTPLLNDELSVPVRMRRKDYRPPPAITNLLKSNTRLLQFMVIRQGLWMRGLGPNQAVMAAQPSDVNNSSTLACASSAVTDSNGTAGGEDEDGAPLYEIVTPRRTEKKVSTTTDVAWI